MNAPLVQISTKRERASIVERLQNAPLVHKFFLGGALCGVIGTAWLGVQLWLMINGQLPFDALVFLILKQLHALIQMHFFLGLFILGFYLQAGPKLFESPLGVPRWAFLLIVPYLLAAVCLISIPHTHLHRPLVAFSFFGTAIVLGRYFRSATLENQLRMGVLSIFGLCSFGAGAFADLMQPFTAMLLFWCGVMAVILAVSQQFIISVFGGRKLRAPQSAILLVLYFTASATGLYALLSLEGARLAVSAFALLAVLTLLYFFTATRAAMLTWRKLEEPLALALSMAQLWGLTGSALLLFGAQHSDSILHIWATGVAITLIIAVSTRVIGVIAAKDVLGRNMLWFCLATWQLVPIGRGLGLFLGLPAWFSWVTGTAAIGVMMLWSCAILIRIAQVFARQLSLRRNEQMVSC